MFLLQNTFLSKPAFTPQQISYTTSSWAVQGGINGVHREIVFNVTSPGTYDLTVNLSTGTARYEQELTTNLSIRVHEVHNWKGNAMGTDITVGSNQYTFNSASIVSVSCWRIA
jgi:hypothetical protein